MNKKTALLIAVFALLLLAGGLGLVFIIWLTPPATGELKSLLAAADDLIARSYRAEAEAALAQAYRASVAPDDYLRVLKRTGTLARQSRNYKDLKEHALASFRKFNDRDDLARIALYACLRDGDIAQALSLNPPSRSLPEIQALEAELILKDSGPRTAGALAANPAFSRYLALDRETDPQRFLAAARELGDDRFSLDAALLYLEAAKVDEANLVARKKLLSPEFDEPAGIIAYEAGAYDEAIKRLSGAAGRSRERADLQIVMGDSALLGSQPERAAGFYEQALQTDPTRYFIPYLNLAWISRRQGFDEKALSLLRRAASLFPRNRPVVSEYAKLLYSRGDRTTARSVLAEYTAQNPDDFAARLLRLTLTEDALTPDRLLLRLKDLYFENPKDERAAAILASSLLANQDLAGARAILTHHAEVQGSGKQDWLAESRGILAAIEGNLTEAAAQLSEAIALSDRWEHRLNRAVVLIELGNLKDAADDLRQALAADGTLAGRPQPGALARLHAYTAVVYQKMGRLPEALRETGLALSLDPANGTAFRVEQKIKDGRRLLEESGRR